jgi:hypothetical protein
MAVPSLLVFEPKLLRVVRSRPAFLHSPVEMSARRALAAPTIEATTPKTLESIRGWVSHPGRGREFNGTCLCWNGVRRFPEMSSAHGITARRA